MTFEEYQVETKKTAIYPKDKAMEYLTLGLVSEAGEVAGKLKKIIRDKNGVMTEQDCVDMRSELGDVLWYISELCHQMDCSMSLVANLNVRKLSDRKERNVISGSGDNR